MESAKALNASADEWSVLSFDPGSAPAASAYRSRASSALALARTDSSDGLASTLIASLEAMAPASAAHACRGSHDGSSPSTAAILFSDADTSWSLAATRAVAAWSDTSLLEASATPSHASAAASRAASSSARAQRSAAVATSASASDVVGVPRVFRSSLLRHLGIAPRSPSPSTAAARAAS